MNKKARPTRTGPIERAEAVEKLAEAALRVLECELTPDLRVIAMEVYEQASTLEHRVNSEE
jgi:hypothetical protein